MTPPGLDAAPDSIVKDYYYLSETIPIKTMLINEDIPGLILLTLHLKKKKKKSKTEFTYLGFRSYLIQD